MRPTTTYTALIGALIARLRRGLGLQQGQLAAVVGVNQSSWSKIEAGGTAISVEYVAVLAPTLKASPGEFFSTVDRIVAHAEAQGVTVYRQRADVPPEAVQGQLSSRALTALVEAALAPSDR
jgi:transcriptional regulator with XRE-family HTH domain